MKSDSYSSQTTKGRSLIYQQPPVGFLPQVSIPSRVRRETGRHPHHRESPRLKKRQMTSALLDQSRQPAGVTGRSRLATPRWSESQRVPLPAELSRLHRRFAEALHPKLITLAGELRR